MKRSVPTSARLPTATAAKTHLRVEVDNIERTFPKISLGSHTPFAGIDVVDRVRRFISALNRQRFYGCGMLTSRRRTFWAFTLFALLALGVSSTSCSNEAASSNAAASSTTVTVAASGKPQTSIVLDKQTQTVLDQMLQYPTGSQAQVSSAVLTIGPGVSTGLHKHDAPMYAYILEGTLTVTYEGGIMKEYSAGSAILEAVGTAHNGENKTDKPVKLLVVNIGAEGVANSVRL